MNRYQSPVPRVAFGVAAVAMTAITIGVSVVLPTMDSSGDERRMLAASKAVITPVGPGSGTGSATLDIVAVREPGLSTAPCSSSKANRNPEG